MIGVLALQGAVSPHLAALAELGLGGRPVRREAELEGLDGLILPGGESTTQLDLLARTGLDAALDRFVRAGRPVLCTCAGLILAAREVSGPAQRSFGWLDVDVARNGWGRQVHSFEAEADGTGRPLVFIRAPRITRVGPGVTVIERFDGEPVGVRQGALFGVTFHPELTPDRAIHRAAFGG